MSLTFIIDIGLWFSFFCGIFVWYWSQGDGGIREWVWKFSYSCNFVEHFQKVRCFVAIVFQSVSHIRLFVTPWTAAHQSPLSFTISRSWLKFMSIELVMLANHFILCWLLLLLPSIFPASGSFPVSHLFHQVAKVLELQHQFFQWIFRVDFHQDWLVWLPFSQRDSQESSPALQFESISSLALPLLYSSTLPSVHDYWKNHSFD